MHKKKFIVSSFYKFVYLRNPNFVKKKLSIDLKKFDIKGTFIIGKEGINASFSVSARQFEKIKSLIKTLISKEIKFKNQFDNKHSFLRLKIKEKKEIVSLGQKNIFPEKMTGAFVQPDSWDKFISDPNSIIIDTRNKYESDIGTFKSSVKTKTTNFRQFPIWFKKNKKKLFKKKIGMFCTGGIRCEKASNFLINEGYKNIFQLEGGIIEYLKKTKNKNKLWQGECFVFDERVSLNDKLEKGLFSQCFACRSAISYVDTKSKYFKQGVSCPKCFKEKSKKQKARYNERRKQIQIAKKKGIKHIGS
tara:strand:- start:207 stop:1118 length:912 start_codon:yes stop_codon:yes gene_type:complete